MGPGRPVESEGPRPSRRLLEFPSRRSRAGPVARVGWIALLTLPASLFVGAACSETTRYNTLSFFFDGVPKPGEEAVRKEGGARPSRRKTPPQAPPKKKLYHHPPYWESRCGTCHNPDGGQLFATAAEGLCQSCHAGFPGEDL